MGALVSFADFYSSTGLNTNSYPLELKNFKSAVETGGSGTVQKLFNAGMIYPISPGVITVPENFVPQDATVKYLEISYSSSW